MCNLAALKVLSCQALWKRVPFLQGMKKHVYKLFLCLQRTLEMEKAEMKICFLIKLLI